MKNRTNEELYEEAYKFLTQRGHKISFKFARPRPGRSSSPPNLDVDGKEMTREQLIALAASYPGWNTQVNAPTSARPA